MRFARRGLEQSEAQGLLQLHARLCAMRSAPIPESEETWTALEQRLADRGAHKRASPVRRPLALAVATLVLAGSTAYAAAPAEVRHDLERAWAGVTSPVRSSPQRPQRFHPSGRELRPRSSSPAADLQPADRAGSGALPVQDVGAPLPSLRSHAAEGVAGTNPGRRRGEGDERRSGTPPPSDPKEPEEGSDERDHGSGPGSGAERDEAEHEDGDGDEPERSGDGELSRDGERSRDLRPEESTSEDDSGDISGDESIVEGRPSPSLQDGDNEGGEEAS